MKKPFFLTLVLLSVLLFSCNDKKGSEKGENESSGVKAETSDFEAVEIASSLPFGTHFPTDSSLINSWVAKSSVTEDLESNENIIQHGWAIWHGLTAMTDQTNNDQSLRVFETWYTPGDIINANRARFANENASLQSVGRKHTGTLETPNQLEHGSIHTDDADVVSFVKYNPAAAEFAFEHEVFFESTLKALIEKGKIKDIPNFPNGAITLKPVFQLLSNSIGEGDYALNAWQGEEGNNNTTKSPNFKVTVSLNKESDPSNLIFNIKDFIHFKIDSAQAEFEGGKVGDYVVLVGMHVTTREIKRWTWQTFWWSTYPDSPHRPSNSHIASIREGATLDRAAAHYAMAIAYNMVIPTQPYYRKDVKDPSFANAQSIYAYNPHLEAGFNQAEFNDTTGSRSTGGYPYFEEYNYPLTVGGKKNDWGMQTNCMSCHGQARYNGKDTKHRYIADAYFGLDDKYFIGTVKTDFAWSILGNLTTKEATSDKQ